MIKLLSALLLAGLFAGTAAAHATVPHHGKDCPPGLEKRHNGCMPPGQARKVAARHDARLDEARRTRDASMARQEARRDHAARLADARQAEAVRRADARQAQVVREVDRRQAEVVRQVDARQARVVRQVDERQDRAAHVADAKRRNDEKAGRWPGDRDRH